MRAEPLRGVPVAGLSGCVGGLGCRQAAAGPGSRGPLIETMRVASSSSGSGAEAVGDVAGRSDSGMATGHVQAGDFFFALARLTLRSALSSASLCE